MNIYWNHYALLYQVFIYNKRVQKLNDKLITTKLMLKCCIKYNGIEFQQNRNSELIAWYNHRKVRFWQNERSYMTNATCRIKLKTIIMLNNNCYPQ